MRVPTLPNVLSQHYYKYRSNGILKISDMQIITKSLNLLSLVILLAAIVFVDMADTTPTTATATATAADSAAVHIVYMERPEGEEEPEAYHIRTLASVLGSEDAAKEALIYSYKNAASGFSAKLTAAQVEQMSKQPGVLQVVPSRTLQLHGGHGIRH